MKPDKPFEKPSTIRIFDLIWVALAPFLIGIVLMVLFGTMYTNEPGRGYGWGLLSGGLLIVSSFGGFLWRYRNYED